MENKALTEELEELLHRWIPLVDDAGSANRVTELAKAIALEHIAQAINRARW